MNHFKKYILYFQIGKHQFVFGQESVFYKRLAGANDVIGNSGVEFKTNTLLSKGQYSIAIYYEDNADSFDTNNVGVVTFKESENETYVIKVYSNGKYVSSNKLTVQDINQKVNVYFDNTDR